MASITPNMFIILTTYISSCSSHRCTKCGFHWPRFRTNMFIIVTTEMSNCSNYRCTKSGFHFLRFRLNMFIIVTLMSSCGTKCGFNFKLLHLICAILQNVTKNTTHPARPARSLPSAVTGLRLGGLRNNIH